MEVETTDRYGEIRNRPLEDGVKAGVVDMGAVCPVKAI
jgi:hypothetical protein